MLNFLVNLTSIVFAAVVKAERKKETDITDYRLVCAEQKLYYKGRDYLFSDDGFISTTTPKNRPQL